MFLLEEEANIKKLLLLLVLMSLPLNVFAMRKVALALVLILMKPGDILAEDRSIGLALPRVVGWTLLGYYLDREQIPTL